MLTVTDNAKDFLKDLIDQANMEEGVALRLIVGNDGLGLTPDVEKENDTTFVKGDETVLLVTEDLATRLDDVTMDVQQTDEGPRLAIAKAED